MSNIISVEVIKDAAKNKTSASLSRPAVAELAGELARMEARIAELEAAIRRYVNNDWYVFSAFVKDTLGEDSPEYKELVKKFGLRVRVGDDISWMQKTIQDAIESADRDAYNRALEDAAKKIETDYWDKRGVQIAASILTLLKP